jgi:4-amino-4-deoxy-L-arabinose transferase-like glycosyltransferase
MVLFFAISHQLASDIFLAAAVAWFYATVFDPRSRTTIWPYVALGVGFMAKGPVVLALTVAPVLLASLWARDGALARMFKTWRGWLAFALIALPWYLIVMIRTPGLMSYFLHRQLWERYATTAHQRGGPVYYFLLVILGGTLPWTWPALRELWRAAWGRRTEDALLASWVLLPFVFFSFSGSKLPAYVLPVFPALAVLASRASVRDWEAGTGRWGARSALPMWAIVFTFVALMALLAAVSPFDSRLGSPRALAAALSKARLPGDHVVEFGTFNAGVPFYLRETVPMLEVPRDIAFADPRARARVSITREDLARTIMTSGRAWVIGNRDRTFALANALRFRAIYVAGFGDQALILLEYAGR